MFYNNVIVHLERSFNDSMVDFRRLQEQQIICFLAVTRFVIITQRSYVDISTFVNIALIIAS